MRRLVWPGLILMLLLLALPAAQAGEGEQRHPAPGLGFGELVVLSGQRGVLTLRDGQQDEEHDRRDEEERPE